MLLSHRTPHQRRMLALVCTAACLAATAVTAQPEAERAKQIRELDKLSSQKLPAAARALELAAPAVVQSTLTAVRSDLLSGKAAVVGAKPTFVVGATSAVGKPASELTGLKIPTNQAAMVPEQVRRTQENLQREDRLTAALSRRNVAGAVLPKAVTPGSEFGCDPSARSFDWRSKGAVSPVRNQKSCGSCWAFAAVAAMEGSSFVQNRTLALGSEQQMLSCSKGGTCEGGWYVTAWDNLQGEGTAEQTAYNYTASDSQCRWSIATPHHWSAWGWVNADERPDRAKIKRELCTRGPLATAVVAGTDAFKSYVGGVFNEASTARVDHAVTIVGWDDAKNAWLIKNSWGDDWGGVERGFMWINYDSNKIGSYTAWVKARKQISLTDDCVSFSDSDARVSASNGGWRITSGSHVVARFQSQADADKALGIIRHYKMTRQCYLGRPNWNFTYFLAGRTTPRGDFAGEKCTKFDLASLDVDRDGQKWRLRDGNKHLKMFDREDDAWMAYAYVRRHSFEAQCSVGEGFNYYRR